MAESGLLDDKVEDAETLLKLLTRAETNGRPFTTEVVSEDAAEIVVRAVERKSRAGADAQAPPLELLADHEYRQLVRLHEQLVATAGTPPFTISLGERHAEALTFGALREEVLNLARHGVNVNRFKGLGEMNRRAVARYDDGPLTADARPRDGRGRRAGRQDLLDADG